MEFLKSCSTNAQAIGDFEAIAYQAFSITRDATTPPAKQRDWNASEDVRAVETELRQDRHLVAHDASRSWLWFLKPITVDKVGQDNVELPALEGYRFHREQTAFLKASELARPPMRGPNPHTFPNASASAAASSQKGVQGGQARQSSSTTQSGTAELHPPDCLMLYELFATSVTALVSYFLVKDCHVVSLNYRTFVSRPALEQGIEPKDHESPAHVSWLTSLSVHWTSSGTVIITTSTVRHEKLRCLDDVAPGEQNDFVGSLVRVAPNASLARVSSFEDPLKIATEDLNLATRRKRARFSTIEQSIERWKATVKRWLGWRGYSLQGLDKATSWVRIRPARISQSSTLSPSTMVLDRDILWPRALCFHLDDDPIDLSLLPPVKSDAQSLRNDLKWFEAPGSAGFKDPIDCAQEWFIGKSERERIAESRRKAMKAEEEATRRKEESSSLYPSSPLNARTGTYGDLQAVSGVYPTPPDGIVPGPSGSMHDTTNSSTGNTNVILAPSGGAHPAINLSAPQDHATGYGDEQSTTSPLFPETSETYNTSGYDDDLFNDIGADASGGMGLNEADFDFFDAPDDEDVQMADVSTMPQANTEEPEKQFAVPELPDQIAVTTKEEPSDPLTALENALATASHAHQETGQETRAEVSDSTQETAPQQPSQPANVSQSKPKSDHEKPIVKPTTPPLSPSGIANALQPSPSIKSAFRKNQQALPAAQDSTFHPLDFSRRLSLADAKYQDGRFANQKENNTDNVGRERVSESTRPKSLRDIPLMTKLRYAAGIASTAMIPEVTSLARVMSDDSDTSSETSEESGPGDDDEDEAPAGPPSFLGRLIIPAKRKLPTEGNATPQSVTSFAESLGGDWFEVYGLQLDDMSLASLEPNSYDWPMLHLTNPAERSLAGARYVMPSLPPPPIQLPDTPTSQPDLSIDLGDEKPTTAKDSIVITQIVTDQLVYSTLDLLGEESAIVPHDTSAAESRWQNLVRTVFPNAADCGFPALVAVHDVYPDLPAQVKGQQRPPPRKPNDSTAVPGNQMYQINSPFVRVRRADNYWDLLPPSIAFWEALGLAPASSAKNVVAFCVYPQSESLKPLLDRFLLNLQIAYDTCKLGTHLRVDTVSEYELGLVPFRVDPVAPSPKAALQSLKDTCIQLGKILAIQCAQIREQLDAKVDAFVIYMIDPFGDASTLWELCSAFWSLYHAYGQINTGRQDQTQRPDLVLQIVPIGYIASFDCPVVLDASTYFNLAREVYDRCPPSTPSTDKTPLNIYKAPAFQLEEGLPRGIPFKLVSEPPQDLMRENSYMHLAYSISLDGTWVTAAWTDNCGKSQAVVSYHLGTRVFGEVAKEIWQTTIEILQSRRVQWRVCIAKSGSMDREELETWVFLITCPTQVNLFLTLLTVNTDAPYKLTPSATSTTQPSTTSPGSTPQPTVSPDPTVGLTPAATPSAEAPDVTSDPEARLVDITDETWGVILAHRLHNSPSTNQFNPALISGLLVKRGETLATSTSQNPTTGPIVVAVNILWIGAVGSTRAATSPFPPSADGVSPGTAAYGNAGGSAPPSPGPGHGHGQERSTTSLMWTPTVQTRATAENLLKEVLGQYRGLGLLAKLRGMKGTRHGAVPWHVVAAQRGVDGLGRVVGGI